MRTNSATTTSSAVQPRKFELVAGHPTLDLVNTLDWRFRKSGPEELLGSYNDLVAFGEQSCLFSAPQARRLIRGVSAAQSVEIVGAVRELRELAAEVLYAVLEEKSPRTASIRALEEYFRIAGNKQQLLWSDSKLTWGLPQSATAAELPVWLLSLKTSELMTSDAMNMIRECGNIECRWLFLDTSKNHTRRWCDMKICGNRMKARRFKAQHQAENG